jgi:hypothetical protein
MEELQNQKLAEWFASLDPAQRTRLLRVHVRGLSGQELAALAQGLAQSRRGIEEELALLSSLASAAPRAEAGCFRRRVPARAASVVSREHTLGRLRARLIGLEALQIEVQRLGALPPAVDASVAEAGCPVSPPGWPEARVLQNGAARRLGPDQPAV